jgi:hypothetical protein
VQTSRVVWSPGSLPIAFGVDPTLVRFVLGAAWLVLTIACLRHEREPASLAALLMLATTLLLTTAFFAHYLVPIVALASISTRPWLRQLALLLSVGALGAYSVEFLAASMPQDWIGSGGYQAAGSVLTLAPATAWLATHGLRRTTTLRVRAARRDLSIRSSRRAGPGGGSAAGRS